MTLRNSTPLAWRPLGITDAADTGMARTGSMSMLANLIPDPSTLGLFQARPASSLLVDFNVSGGPFSSGFSSGFQHGFFPGLAAATDLTCLRIFGSRVY